MLPFRPLFAASFQVTHDIAVIIDEHEEVAHAGQYLMRTLTPAIAERSLASNGDSADYRQSDQFKAEEPLPR